MAKKKVHVEYSVERDLTEEIDRIITENPRFHALKEKLVIASCFVIRMDDNGESQPGKGHRVIIKKVAPEMQALIRSKPNFVLVVDYHWWNECSPSEKRGVVNRSLTRIRFEEDEGGIKTGLLKWDIEEMFSNLETSGVYDERTMRLKEIMSRTQSLMVDAVANTLERAEKNEDDEPPRVVARPVSRAAKNKTEARRPARKIPPEPEPEPDTEPEPED